MQKLTPALALVALLSLGACGAPEDDDGTALQISTEPLSGTIAGQPWTFVQGSTNAFLSDDEDFFSKLYDASYTSCDAFTEPSDVPFMLLGVPTVLGETRFGFTQNATFVPSPGENLVGTSGGIIVTEITATTVTAGLLTSFDSDNSVEGYFTVDICP